MESITLRGWCKVQFVITAELGALKLDEQIRRLHCSVGKADLNDVHIGLSKVQKKIY